MGQIRPVGYPPESSGTEQPDATWSNWLYSGHQEGGGGFAYCPCPEHNFSAPTGWKLCWGQNREPIGAEKLFWGPEQCTNPPPALPPRAKSHREQPAVLSSLRLWQAGSLSWGCARLLAGSCLGKCLLVRAYLWHPIPLSNPIPYPMSPPKPSALYLLQVTTHSQIMHSLLHPSPRPKFYSASIPTPRLCTLISCPRSQLPFRPHSSPEFQYLTISSVTDPAHTPSIEKCGP